MLRTGDVAGSLSLSLKRGASSTEERHDCKGFMKYNAAAKYNALFVLTFVDSLVPVVNLLITIVSHREWVIFYAVVLNNSLG